MGVGSDVGSSGNVGCGVGSAGSAGGAVGVDGGLGSSGDVDNVGLGVAVKCVGMCGCISLAGGRESVETREEISASILKSGLRNVFWNDCVVGLMSWDVCVVGFVATVSTLNPGVRVVF